MSRQRALSNGAVDSTKGRLQVWVQDTLDIVRNAHGRRVRSAGVSMAVLQGKKHRHTTDWRSPAPEMNTMGTLGSRPPCQIELNVHRSTRWQGAKRRACGKHAAAEEQHHMTLAADAS